MTVAGVPLRVSPLFVITAAVFGWIYGVDVKDVRFVEQPAMPDDWRELSLWLQTHDPMHFTTTQPSTGWVIAAMLGAALVFALSIVAHELGHFAAARACNVEVDAIQLGPWGGWVEVHDDRLTAGKLTAIVAAGPLVTAFLVLGAYIALRTLGWPLTGIPDLQTSAGVTAGRILASAFTFNAVLLVMNLLPFRPLDGGQLLAAARLRLSRA
jgi:Zn-dependent protease